MWDVYKPSVRNQGRRRDVCGRDAIARPIGMQIQGAGTENGIGVRVLVLALAWDLAVDGMEAGVKMKGKIGRAHV